MSKEEIEDIIKENDLRKERLNSPYNPGTGLGSPIKRIKVDFFYHTNHYCLYLPERMYMEHSIVRKIKRLGSIEKALNSEDPVTTATFMHELTKIRFKYDFEFWAYVCAKIQHKTTKKEVPFVLNKAQRKFLRLLEKMRMEGVPIRIILLKARQWGGSTLVEIYMAWIQQIHKTNWHSAIIADVEDQSKHIRGMYKRLANLYPKEFGKITFVPYEGSTKTKVIKERNCIVGVGSAQEPENLRSYDFAMLHLSEVGLWKSTPMKSAEDLAQSIRGTVPTIADSLIVMESTAKGVGNFFHREWQTAKKGTSSYIPIFVAWFEIERYQKKIKPSDLYDFITWVVTKESYAKYLWLAGATLEGIKWYYDFKNGENYDDWRMKSEYPSNDIEAFQSTGRRVFRSEYVAKARVNCKTPEFIGEIVGEAQTGPDSLKNLKLEENGKGSLFVWALPDLAVNIKNRYALFGDIGGRSDGSDYSCLTVVDRYWMMEGGKPEIVATWWGHLDQDIFAWKCAQVASFWGMGLLAIETNSLRSRKDTEGDHFVTVLDEIAEYYNNLFARTDPEKIKQKAPIKWGFHTNSGTKSLIINTHNAALRDDLYVERWDKACDEMDTLEYKEDGSIGAVEGSHDDIAITRAGCVWMALKYMDMPIITEAYIPGREREVQSEASFG